MALNFPSTTGQPTDGSFTYTAGGVTWIWDGSSWRSGISSSESDPVYSSSPASNVTNQKIQNWDAAFSWGDHSQAGYGSGGGGGGGSMNELVDDTTPQLGGVLDCNGFAIDFGANVITDADVGNYDTAYGWGDHSTAGYLTSLPAIAIGSLSDVTISTPSTGQVLTYNGTAWVNSAPTGGGGSSYADSDVDTHLNVSGASSGQILSWNGTDYAWVADQTGSVLSNIVDSAQGVNVTGKVATTDGMDIDIGGSINAAGTSIDFQNTTISFSGASIGGLTGTIKDATIITWTLTANGTTDYVFSGDGFPTSKNDPDLYLVRGETYRFVNNTGGHPFRIQSTTASSGGGTKYDDGVQNSDGTVNDAGNGVTLTFVVPMDAPDTLYYQCTSHPNMFGTINILPLDNSDGVAIGDDDGTKVTSLKIGDDADLILSYDGTTGVEVSFIESNALILRTKTTPNENYITCLEGGAVELFYNDSKKLATSASGVSVLGDLSVSDSISDALGPIRRLGQNIQSGNYTLVASDAGKHIRVDGAHTITIPDAVFSAGDMITIVANSASDVSITQGSGLDLYNAADGTTGNKTLAARTVCTILFAEGGSGAKAYIAGGGIS